jgi:adenosylhomocysteine nucleosidase
MTGSTIEKLVAVVCVCLGASVGPAGPGAAAGQQRREAVTAILGAMDSEVAPIVRQMSDKQTQRHLGVAFTVGKLNGRSVVVARTGVGKVNAAMVTTLLLDHYRPGEVIFTGIAGCVNPQMQPGDVVIGSKMVQHDLGNVTPRGLRARGVRSPVDGKRNPVFLGSDGELVALAERAAAKLAFDAIEAPDGRRRPEVRTGVIATGDVFVASGAKRASLRKRLGADAVEMEGAAVAQVCHQQKVGFLVIRGLSDRANENVHRDLRKFLQAAAGNAAKLTASVVGELTRAKRPAAAPRRRKGTGQAVFLPEADAESRPESAEKSGLPPFLLSEDLHQLG